MANLKAEINERVGEIGITMSKISMHVESIRACDTPSFMLDDYGHIERLLTAARYQNASVRRAIRALQLQREKGGA